MRALLDFLFGLIGWTGAIFSPVLLALAFWHAGNRSRWGWLAHLLFAPSALGAEWLFGRMIFFAAHDDGSGPPGLGLFLILPMIVLIGSIAIYYLAVALRGTMMAWRKLSQRR